MRLMPTTRRPGTHRIHMVSIFATLIHKRCFCGNLVLLGEHSVAASISIFTAVLGLKMSRPSTKRALLAFRLCSSTGLWDTISAAGAILAGNVCKRLLTTLQSLRFRLRRSGVGLSFPSYSDKRFSELTCGYSRYRLHEEVP